MRAAGAAGGAEPPDEIDRGAPGEHDVPVGGVRGAVWRVRHRAGVQHPHPGAAAVFLSAVFDELGAVFAVWAVSGFCCGASRSLFFPHFLLLLLFLLERPLWRLELAIGLFRVKNFAVGGGEEGGFVMR